MAMDRKAAVAEAEDNRQMTRKAIFGKTLANPNITKAYMIQDETYDYSSRELKEKEPNVA
jgi:hypothetical protein